MADGTNYQGSHTCTPTHTHTHMVIHGATLLPDIASNTISERLEVFSHNWRTLIIFTKIFLQRLRFFHLCAVAVNCTFRPKIFAPSKAN